MEWRLFKRALVQEYRMLKEKEKTAMELSLQDVKDQMEAWLDVYVT